MTLVWDKEVADFKRGNAVEAATLCDLDQIRYPLIETCEKLVEIAEEFRQKNELSVVVEVWPDTGRVIFRVSDDREFARVILRIQELECHYYELSSLGDDEFESEYNILVTSILDEFAHCWHAASTNRLSCAINFVGRATDDNDTERSLAV